MRPEDGKPVNTQRAVTESPYRRCRHNHSFEGCNGCALIKDTVEYAVRGGAPGNFFAWWLGRRDVVRIFDYRAQQISARFSQRSLFPGTPGGGSMESR